jgi:hypothetical protein
MSRRFPAPWRIVEMPRGYAVEDADGQQLGVFYGRSDQNAAGHTGFLTMEEARQMAFDFAKLPELLEQMTLGSEIVKAARRRTLQSLKLKQNGKHNSPERLPGNLRPRSEILKHVKPRWRPL